jgi:hypothetical protein
LIEAGFTLSSWTTSNSHPAVLELKQITGQTVARNSDVLDTPWVVR